MLEIIGLSYNDLTPVVPVAGTISGNATIGRGRDNAIVLPDPKRLVSRQHLKFTLGSDNVYWVSDIGSGNPVFINGEELASGKEYPLQNHDKILVGGYVLQVTYVGQGREDAPRAQPASSSPPSPSPSPAPVSDDALSDDFLAELLGSTPTQGSLAALGLEAEVQGELTDPFQYGVTTSRHDDIVQTLNERGIEPGSLDDKGDELINGEDASAMMDELLEDPLNPQSNRQLRHDPNLDPLAVFGDENRDEGVFGDILQAGKGTTSNMPSATNLTHGSELEALFHLPDAGGQIPPFEGSPATPVELPDLQPAREVKAEIPPGSMGMVHGSELDALFGLPGSGEKPSSTPRAVSPAPDVKQPDVGNRSIENTGNIVSHDDIDDFITGLEPAARTTAADPLSSFLPETDSTDVSPPPVDVPVRSSTSSTPETFAAAPGMEELYRAFVEGLGMELPGRTGLDKAFMNMLGQALRNYTQGAVELIAGRTVVKQAVRANVTVIAPERNNPLKFAPDVHTAMLGMFGRTMPGFMGPVEAIRNAFVDLRAHQIGVISGMQAALNHVLDRFNPAMIGDRIPPQGVLENVFSVLYKARLWEEYGYYFQALREKASDHFHEFFGEAFVEAYEKAILTVQSGEKAGRS